MSYAVKEIFYTLQGEGAQTGRAAVFCALPAVICGRDANSIARMPSALFATPILSASTGPKAAVMPTPTRSRARSRRCGRLAVPGQFVVCTGGEPLLQLDPPLVDALHRHGFEIAIETNGTILPPPGLDWVCVSPKAGAPLVVERGDELKIVVPQLGLDPLDFAHLAFRRFSVQPMDGPERARNTALAMEFCRAHPQWRLSLQTHKLAGFR